jgi:hypothetical protein
MDHQSRIYLLAISCRIVAPLLLNSAWEGSCLAAQLALPDVGTNISYSFSADAPVFIIAEDVPFEDALQSQITFGESKHLRMEAEGERHILHIALTLRAPGIASLFTSIFNRLDETLTLFGKDSAILATADHNSLAYDDESGDYCTIGWGFEFASNVSYSGFEWTITPTSDDNVLLPETLSLETHMSAAGAILVVPEPKSTSVAIVCIVTLTALCRPRRGQCIAGRDFALRIAKKLSCGSCI